MMNRFASFALTVACLATVGVRSFAGESPYQFRKFLEQVHKPDRCDRTLRPVEGKEYAFVDGCVVPDADFADYLRVSMNVDAKVGENGVVSVTIDRSLAERSYRIEVGRHGVRIVAKDDRARAQAFYHLEDLMNLRREPGGDRPQYGSRRMLFGAAHVQEVRICRVTDDGVRQVFLDLHRELRGDTPRRVRFSGSGCEVDGR